MAKNYWFGKDIKINVSNKAADNSGISTVNATSTDMPFDALATTDVTDKGALGAEVSVATFKAIACDAANAGSDGSKTFAANSVNMSVTWASGGVTDEHAIPEDIILCREATAAAVNVSKSTVWSDEEMPLISLSTTAATGTPYKTAPYAKFDSNDAASLPVTDKGTAKNSFTPTLVKNVAINGQKTITFSATTVANDVPADNIAASQELTATTNTVTVKNATASITLNGLTTPTTETSIYLKAGDAQTGSKTVTYTVNPDVTDNTADSVVFNDEVSKYLDPDSDDIVIATATLGGSEGSRYITLTPSTSTGSTQLQLKSKQTSKADGILSSIINIIVTISDIEKHLNMGDAITIDMQSDRVDKIEVSTDKSKNDWVEASMLTLTSGTATAENSVSAVISEGDNVTFKVGTNAGEGSHYFRINGVTIVTITTQHVSIALA